MASTRASAAKGSVGPPAFKRETSRAQPPRIPIARASQSPPPLVPLKWISAPNQRLVAATVFVLLQAYKVQSLLANGAGMSQFMFFSFLDAVFLVALPILRIPWLVYKTWVIWAQFSLLALLNIALFADGRSLYVLGLLLKKLFRASPATLGGSRIGGAAASHLQNIQGTYVVRYLPESSVTMMFDEPLCLVTNGEAFVHLVLNSTTASEITLLNAAFEGYNQNENQQNEKSDAGVAESNTHTIHYPSSEIARFYSEPDKKHKALTHLWLPILEPGLFRLHSVVDKTSSLPVRVFGDLIAIPPCPSVRLGPISGPVCEGDSFTAQVDAEGLVPLRVDLADGESLTPPPQNYEKYEIGSQQLVYTQTSARAGRETARVLAVHDALGNVVQGSDHDIQTVDVYERPRAVFSRQGHNYALPGDHVDAELDIKGQDAPFEVLYHVNDSPRKTSFGRAGRHSIKITEPGTYRLQSINGALCKGSVAGQVTAFVPPPVEMTVEFKELEGKCSGPSGVQADVKLSGTAPFVVGYRTIKNGRVIARDERVVSQSSETFTFKPDSIGDYDYQFYSVKDKYREQSYAGNGEYEKRQVISEIAGATFGRPLVTSYCPGEISFITARVQGKGPLDLLYSVDGVQFTEKDIDGDVSLNLGNLTGGDHVVELLSISDSRGCSTPLNLRSPIINVRERNAKARFAGPSYIQVGDLTDPPLKLPIDVVDGEAPYRIVYQLDNGPEIEVTTNTPEIPVDKVGTYKLVRFSDKCRGEVDEQTVTVAAFEKPKLEVVSAPSAICVDKNATFDLVATGNPPFTLTFESQNPRGELHYDKFTSKDGKFQVELPPQSISGVYTNLFWLTDNIYRKLDGENPKIVELKMNSRPVARFPKPLQEFSVCPSQKLEFPVSVKGTGPFELYFDAQNVKTRDVTRLKVDVPDVRHYQVSELDQLKELAREKDSTWSIRLTTIKDAAGCSSRISKHESGEVRATFRKPPSVPQPKDLKHDYCVGQTVKIPLEGQGLLDLQYSFNGRKHRASVMSTFSRLASSAGQFELISLRDESGCATDLAGVDNVVVHELPSSRITNKADYSIHRGDSAALVFQFSGVAPFTFTYTRSLNGKVRETKTIKGLEEPEFTLHATLDGEYRVVFLKDKFCSVRAD